VANGEAATLKDEKKSPVLMLLVLGAVGVGVYLWWKSRSSGGDPELEAAQEKAAALGRRAVRLPDGRIAMIGKEGGPMSPKEQATLTARLAKRPTCPAGQVVGQGGKCVAASTRTAAPAPR
jgi:hypothetical protein